MSLNVSMNSSVSPIAICLVRSGVSGFGPAPVGTNPPMLQAASRATPSGYSTVFLCCHLGQETNYYSTGCSHPKPGSYAYSRAAADCMRSGSALLQHEQWKEDRS